MDFQYPPCAWNPYDGYTNTDQPTYPYYYWSPSPPPPPYSMPDPYFHPWTYDAAAAAQCTMPCCAPPCYAFAPAPPAPAPASPKRSYANKHEAPCTTPPALRPGTRLLHAPGEHVEFRLVDGQPWAEEAPPQQQLALQAVAAPAGLTVRELILRLGGGKGFAIGEALEDGCGAWRLGITVKEGDDKMGKGIAAVGWTRRREKAGPIWIAVWKP